jgi:hypothetical protein
LGFSLLGGGLERGLQPHTRVVVDGKAQRGPQEVLRQGLHRGALPAQGEHLVLGLLNEAAPDEHRRVVEGLLGVKRGVILTQVDGEGLAVGREAVLDVLLLPLPLQSLQGGRAALAVRVPAPEGLQRLSGQVAGHTVDVHRATAGRPAVLTEGGAEDEQPLAELGAVRGHLGRSFEECDRLC